MLDDSTKFYKNLADKYGIPQDWIELADYDVNYPKLKDNFKLKDPSSVIKNAYDKTKALLAETEIQMTMADFHFASWSDTANTLVLPAMSLSAAVENMKGIVKIANQKIEQERKEGIAAIFTAVFFFIPFVG